MDDGIETLMEGKHLTFVQRGTWEFVTRKNISGIVIVLPITDEGKVVLIEQFRPPVNSRVIELCAGLAGDIPGQEDEALEIAVQRELHEECGYEAGHIEPLMEGPPAQGVTDEYLSFFKATGLRKTGDGGGDEHEDIQVHEVPLDGVDQWLKDRLAAGIMVDPKVYAALYFTK